MKIYKNKQLSNLIGLVIVFLITQLFLSSLNAQAKTLDISVNKEPLAEVLSMIEEQADVYFIYNDNDVDIKRKVTLNVKNGRLNTILDLLFENTPNYYKINKQQVYIILRETPSKLVSPSATIKNIKISGIVLDDNNQELIGAQVIVRGSAIGAVTDVNGKFELIVPENSIITVNYIGFASQDIQLDDKTYYVIEMSESVKALEEVIVVGYGQQKKESVVGAIAQTTGDDLMRTGVVTSVGQTLTGLLPGVMTTTNVGMPGEEDPRIRIRGVSSWNNTEPLVLIDGVKRSMSHIDVGQIESISVLKDASATAVFGVEGAEGVILITTKRGREGKASVSFSSNVTFKSVSRVPDRLSSYEIFSFQNEVLEKQNPAFPNNWGFYLPQTELEKYRNPSSLEEAQYYPNIMWSDEIAKPFALTQRYDLNVTGGTAFAKYFAAFSYTKDDDLLKSGLDVGLPYKPKWGFEHYNFRSNLDLNITKSTILSTNLAGSIRKRDGFTNAVGHIWRAFYALSPAAFPIQYEDGTFGYNINKPDDVNPMMVLSGGSGLFTQYATQFYTDFALKQDLNFLLPGLSAAASLSYDMGLYSSSSINYIDLLSKSVSKDGVINYNPASGGNEMDYFKLPGSHQPENFNTGSTGRKLYYKIQTNYEHTFADKHDVTALALMSREMLANGSEFPHYREDWVGRVTYAYDDRYFIEGNGAYNGSEKFGRGYRFGFFPSIGVGWMLSNENFLKLAWLERLKLRYSIGTVGSDKFSGRWAYMENWAQFGGNKVLFGDYLTSSNYNAGPGTTYLTYTEAGMGNPDLHWEVSQKQNLGLDFRLLNSLISGSFELFRDDRHDIFISADSRTLPNYLGAAPVSANLGKVLNKGFEFEVKVQKTWQDFHAWISYNYMHAKDKVIYSEDPELKPNYQKAEGFSIGQTRIYTEQPGFVTSWDDLYGSVGFDANNQRQPGDITFIDYNGDGVIDTRDIIPYGFPNRPQDAYNIRLGTDWKGLSFMIHFMGVYNITQLFSSIGSSVDARSPYASPQVLNYWTPNNPDAVFMLRTQNSYASSRGFYLDASYVRLKTMELAYTLNRKWTAKYNLSSVKVTLSGNNLFLWSEMPDDRESTAITYDINNNLYPTLRRFNLGLSVTF